MKVTDNKFKPISPFQLHCMTCRPNKLQPVDANIFLKPLLFTAINIPL